MLNKLAGMLKVDQFVENIVGYLEARIELAKLDFRKELAGVLAKLIVLTIAIIGATGLFLSFTMALGYWLNVVLDSSFAGFFVVAGFYAIVTFIGLSVSNNKKWIASLQGKIEERIFAAELEEQKNGNENTNPIDDGGA